VRGESRRIRRVGSVRRKGVELPREGEHEEEGDE
jgi:hypothetical protein